MALPHTEQNPIIQGIHHAIQLLAELSAVQDPSYQQFYSHIQPHYTPQGAIHSVTLKKQPLFSLTLFNAHLKQPAIWQRASINLLQTASLTADELNQQLNLILENSQLELVTQQGQYSPFTYYHYYWQFSRKITALFKVANYDGITEYPKCFYQVVITKN